MGELAALTVGLALGYLVGRSFQAEEDAILIARVEAAKGKK